MAGELGFQKPTGALVANPRMIALVRELECETASGCYPGRLAKAGSTDAEAVVNDTSNNSATLLGWIGYEQASLDDRPDTIDTVWTVNKSMPILNGPGMVLRGWLASNSDNTITTGEMLAAASTLGAMDKAVVGTDHVVAIALEPVTNTTPPITTAAKEIFVVSLI